MSFDCRMSGGLKIKITKKPVLLMASSPASCCQMLNKEGPGAARSK